MREQAGDCAMAKSGLLPLLCCSVIELPSVHPPLGVVYVAEYVAVVVGIVVAQCTCLFLIVLALFAVVLALVVG